MDAPYRGAPPPHAEAGMLKCPFCGGPCACEARRCPHCDVELASMRCPKCYALHFTGSRFCARCGEELHAEALLDASDAPCPRCATPLKSSHEIQGFECTKCGGLFVEHAAFASMSAEREAHALPFAAPKSASMPMSGPDAQVHYVKCPCCAEIMNRVNFGRRSGVIIDVCKMHGTWFDAGELTRVLEWIAAGGAIEARRREHDEVEREKHALHERHVAEARALLDAQQPHGLRFNDGGDTFIEMLFHFFKDGL